ncbi:MAG: DNA recombination protein RmuC [Geminicoccaceae bacterium]|nr:MAG: DNA recombination protein RmuC [Geminicoccaceae bacterium]
MIDDVVLWWLGLAPGFAFLAAAAVGVVLGLWLGVALARVRRRELERLAEAMHEVSEDRHRMAAEAMLDRARAAFGELSMHALARSSERLMDLADARLGAERGQQAALMEQKKVLIDQELERIGRELDRMRRLVVELERDRAAKFGEVSARLDAANAATQALAGTTQNLKEALKSSQRRGQWGERLAEDVLRQAGFVEGVSYVRQTTEAGGGRPDFTFLLPRDLKLHMDVKFPLDNYLRYVEASSDAERARLERAFLADVRQKVRELAARNYGQGDGAIDYVLLFIPNEPLAGFVFERRPELVDEALGLRVVPCAPATLFAVLAVVRQAVDNFVLAESADDMLRLLARFHGAWRDFAAEMERLGRKIEEVQDSFHHLAGTRSRTLERPLARLEQLRQLRGVPNSKGGDDAP